MDEKLKNKDSDGAILKLSWSHPSWRTGLQMGDVDYYCLQVWRGRYKHKGLSVEALVKEIGGNPDEHKKFLGYRSTLLEYYISSGGRTQRVFWTRLLCAVQ